MFQVTEIVRFLLGAAGGRAARGAAAEGRGRSTEGRSTEGRSAAASKQTRMACHRTATDSHAEKSGCGAGGAGAAAAREQVYVPVRDVERADLQNRMRVRCAAGAEGARRA
jgi:hypothetical protein